jgi:hypothetical protein
MSKFRFLRVNLFTGNAVSVLSSNEALSRED